MNVGLMRFLREISSFAKKNTFVFDGDEPYFQRRGFQTLLEKWRSEHEVEEEHFSASTHKIGQVVEALSEFPLTGDFKVVVLTDFDKMRGWEKIKPFLVETDEEIRFIATSSADAPRELRDLSFELRIVCKEMRPGSKEFNRYVEYCLLPFGKQVDDSALEHLGGVFANNPTLLNGELQKAAFYSEGPTITAAVLEKTLTTLPIARVFDLVDAVIQRNLQEALTLALDIFQQGTEGKFLTYLITQRIQTIHAALLAQKKGERLKDFMIRKKVPLFQAEQIVNGLRNLKEYHIRRWYDVLAETEAAMMRGDQQRVFERMVVTLCH